MQAHRLWEMRYKEGNTDLALILQCHTPYVVVYKGSIKCWKIRTVACHTQLAQ